MATNKLDLWNRCTSAEAGVLDAYLQNALAKVRRLWESNPVVQAEEEALVATALKFSSPARIAELLAPPG